MPIVPRRNCPGDLDFAGARDTDRHPVALTPGDSRVQGCTRADRGSARCRSDSRDDKASNSIPERYAWANVDCFSPRAADYPPRASPERALAITRHDAFHSGSGNSTAEGRLRRTGEFQKMGGDGVRRMGDAMIEHANGHEKQRSRALKDLIASTPTTWPTRSAMLPGGAKDKA